MTLTPQIKQSVVDTLLRDMQERGFSSQSAYARYIQNLLDIKFDKSAFSLIKKADGRNAIKESSWLRLAKHFRLLGDSQWVTAETETYKTIHLALDLCRENGIWQVLCDGAGLGKSYAAIEYAKAHKETVIYVDCSECGTKNDFITSLAARFGLERTSTYTKLWREVMDELLLLDRPLLLLDEFGDVADSVITLLKTLYNRADAGDHMDLGCYCIGANNLQKRLTDGRKRNKQSYAEFWSRFDNKITDLKFDPQIKVRREQIQLEVQAIVDRNLPTDLAGKRDEIVAKCTNTMGVRAIRKEIALQQKINNLNAI